MLSQIIYGILHFKEYLFPLIEGLGNWSYILIFILIFMETGLVIFPFLPGESLIFFTSAIASVKNSILDIRILFLVYFFAALIGDTVNFEIGKHLKRLPFFKKHLTEARLQAGIRFYHRHGGKTVIFGRFIPLIRTFVPLISGTIGMSTKKFAFYNLLGVLLWVSAGSFLGYFFGQVPFVQQHFSEIFVGIAICAIIPAIFAGISNFLKRRKEKMM
ncbi:VTT domain-containing protein [Ligilactobacillus cholophilus]|uniref:VTT domain-containing protein n=1 Tax=Ligilactobacillus cholophilus TaxID=3050131 RepID=UPI0025B0C2B2|nr:VTT domain-containing protein [Ligilactobacillus cholophilus]